MQNIAYRNLEKKDFDSIKELINDAFSFNSFIHNKDLLETILNLYLEETILESSFIKVATMNNKVIGIILCKANKDSNNYNNLLDNFNKSCIETSLPFESESDKREISEFLKIKDTYYELLRGSEYLFEGAINLFIVSKESRGLGIGKNLLNFALEYMRDMGITSIYLFTDTRCNYGFYDSQNFKLLTEKSIYIHTLESNIKTFLYYYNL